MSDTLLDAYFCIVAIFDTIVPFFEKLALENKSAESIKAALSEIETTDLYSKINKIRVDGQCATADMETLENVAHQCKAIRKPLDKLIKQLLDLLATAQKELQLTKNKDWKELNVQTEHVLPLKTLQLSLCGNPDEDEPGLLHETEYFWRQAHWLNSRFPNGVYADVEGLCKVVSRAEIESKDWSLSPGRYVGVDAATEDDFDYEERLAEIHIELDGLNEEAIALAQLIQENYKSMVL
jgi:type I restriction enzyme M protein